jgi:lipase chaperone LimK
MDTTTLTPAEAHRDAVQYLAAVRRAQARLTARLRAPQDAGERRLTEWALEALASRHDAALADLHAAADALNAAKPECCRLSPVPHEPSSRCVSGRRTGRKHCTCSTCW